MLVAGLIAAIVLWLADRTHQWYLYTIAGVMGFTLLIAYVESGRHRARILDSSHGPVHGRPLQRDLAHCERARTGVHRRRCCSSISRRTHVDSAAYVLGWGGTQRAVIADTMLAGSTPAEMRFLFARAIAWISANDGLHIALVQGAFHRFGRGAGRVHFRSHRLSARRRSGFAIGAARCGDRVRVSDCACRFTTVTSRNVDRLTDPAAVACVTARSRQRRFAWKCAAADQALLPVCPESVRRTGTSTRAFRAGDSASRSCRIGRTAPVR